MTTSRPALRSPASRRLLGIIALVVLLIAAVPAVSAEIIIDEHISSYTDTSGGGRYSAGGSVTVKPGMLANTLRFNHIENHQTLHYIIAETDGNVGKWNADQTLITEGRHDFTYTFNGRERPGVLYVARNRNILGDVTKTRLTIFLNDWDITGLTGIQYIEMPFYVAEGGSQPGGSSSDIFFCNSDRSTPRYINIDYTYASGIYWENHLVVDKGDYGYDITLIRSFNGVIMPSKFELLKDDTQVFYSDSLTDLSLMYPLDSIDTISIITPDNTPFIYNLASGGDPGTSPGTSPVTIYVKSSQTGALLADAHIEIQDTTTDPWTEVVNQTLSSGHDTIYLAKDPGLHLTQYRIGATVPGYQQVVPALFFRVTGPTNVVVEMEPLEGGPVNEDNTYLEFYVRDLNANGISNAQVFVDGQMRWTNAAGYTQFEVAKNASYPYSVSKSGYVTIEGTATVADGPRYVVNVVLGPKEIPTYTPDPGETPGGPGATPTPDRRTNEEKGQAVIDMIADNAEGIGALALICLLMGLLKLIAKW